MKQLIVLFLCLFTFYGFGQVVDIPDANFLAALIEDGVDTNGDGVIQVSEAEGVLEMDVSYENIYSLEGIEGFKNIRSLTCNRNELQGLNVSDNLLLEELDCSSNNFDELDVSNNLQLYDFNCSSNNLTQIVVSNNTLLNRFDCSLNNINEIEMGRGFLKLSCIPILIRLMLRI